jgi:hypothetical protein
MFTEMAISLLLQLGRLPVELAALNDCMEEVEMLFPLTLPIPGVPNWSVDGVISHAKLESAKPLVCYVYLELLVVQIILCLYCALLSYSFLVETRPFSPSTWSKVRFDWPFDNFESKVQSCRRKYS